MTTDPAQCLPLLAPSRADLGKAIRELRLERGMTMQDLTFAADLHSTTLSPIELGKRAPMWETLCSLAAAMEIRVLDVVQRAELVANTTGPRYSLRRHAPLQHGR